MHAEPIKILIQNMRLLSDSFQCHKSNDGLKIGKRTFVENHILKVSTIVSIYLKFQYLDIRNSVLETEHTPGLMLMSRVSILSLNHYFD